MGVKVTFTQSNTGHIKAPSGTVRLDGVHNTMTALIDEDVKEKKAALANVVRNVAGGLTRDITMQLAGPDRPHRRTGDLQRSIQFRAGRSDLEKVVYSDMKYAPYLEYGTSRHPPYPFFLPNVQKWAKVFVKQIREVLAR